MREIILPEDRRPRNFNLCEYKSANRGGGFRGFALTPDEVVALHSSPAGQRETDCYIDKIIENQLTDPRYLLINQEVGGLPAEEALKAAGLTKEEGEIVLNSSY